jgi:hypothetical protein
MAELLGSGNLFLPSFGLKLHLKLLHPEMEV